MIYFHIPFCKQACHYCDFHFSTSLQHKDDMLSAIEKELGLRANYLEDKVVHSVYFGGGTPSLLNDSEINRLVDHVAKHFEIAPDAEITLEANPDDLDPAKVTSLRHTAINRFSIGIQSFYEEDLRWMNRAHNSTEAESAVKRVQDAGFERITCDLIYGFPLLTDEKWMSNMQKLIDFDVPHISAYAMSVEKKTALDYFIKQGKTAAMDEEQSAAQMLMMIDTLTRNRFEHYEISNFAKNGHYAKHNTNYWKGRHYLGLGPSAHSFNGVSRSWNIANNQKYIQAIRQQDSFYETEILSIQNRINEYIMTALRTMWGINLSHIEKIFGQDIATQIIKEAQTFLDYGQLELKGNHLVLSSSGKVIADHIMSELFFVE
jgi:oxygen-independent coproporphyrinogen-3 oxidase